MSRQSKSEGKISLDEEFVKNSMSKRSETGTKRVVQSMPAIQRVIAVQLFNWVLPIVSGEARGTHSTTLILIV